jgi:hypothetical protein
MFGGNRVAGAPFADRVGGDFGQCGGGVRAAEAVDDGVYGDWHEDGVLEIFSGFNLNFEWWNFIPALWDDAMVP